MGQPEAAPSYRSVPEWQKGVPQSMQRAACCGSVLASKAGCASFQSLTRSRGGRAGRSSRSNSMNPVG